MDAIKTINLTKKYRDLTAVDRLKTISGSNESEKNSDFKNLKNLSDE